MFLRSINSAFLVVVVVCLGCSDSIEHPLSKTVADDRPTFTLNSTLPFRIEFGRGSGWHGLDTVALNESGNVVMHRQTPTGWETASFTLTQNELNAILTALNQHQIFSLKREYHADVADGTQWVFWATQNTSTKTVYFNNYFPESIIAFASDLDAQLHIGKRQLTWTSVPPGNSRNHEKELWASITSS